MLCYCVMGNLVKGVFLFEKVDLCLMINVCELVVREYKESLN